METVRLSTSVLGWAASQVGCSLEEFAPRISRKNAEKIAGGELTSAEAIKFSKEARVPLGYLFLPEPPPARHLPVADFRTLPYAQPLSKDFFDVFDDIQYKQAWYREYLTTIGADPLPFVGKFQRMSPRADAVASDMREVLQLAGSDMSHLRTPDDLFGLLVAKCERIGVLVFKNGVVGNNTKRPLSVSEFRGFALTDPLAPVIFVNGADAPAAWVFTLAHELAHIWLGESGVSDAAPRSQNNHERFCNSVAAEFLVPSPKFLEAWNSAPAGMVTGGRLDLVRRQFKVSALVVARRAFELGLIDQQEYAQAYENARRNKGSGSNGGDFYLTLAVRNSKKFSERVASLAISGSMTLREAGRLLNTNPNNVVKFHAKQNPLSV